MTKNKDIPNIDITNVGAHSKISGFGVDAVLKKNIDIILKKIPGAKYRPKGFPATVIPIGSNKINLYDSGKITLIKSPTEENAIESLHNFVKKMNSIGIDCKLESKPEISMISAIVEYHGTINLDALRNTPNYTKDVQSFPAIQLSFPKGVAVKAFAEKLVITAKTVVDMIPAIHEIEKYTTRDVK